MASPEHTHTHTQAYARDRHTLAHTYAHSDLTLVSTRLVHITDSHFIKWLSGGSSYPAERGPHPTHTRSLYFPPTVTYVHHLKNTTLWTLIKVYKVLQSFSKASLQVIQVVS